MNMVDYSTQNIDSRFVLHVQHTRIACFVTAYLFSSPFRACTVLINLIHPQMLLQLMHYATHTCQTKPRYHSNLGEEILLFQHSFYNHNLLSGRNVYIYVETQSLTIIIIISYTILTPIKCAINSRIFSLFIKMTEKGIIISFNLG